MSPWCKRQLLGEVAGPQVAGRVEGFGQVPRAVITSIAWDFTPEQASNLGKLMRHLIKGSRAYPSENQQYWFQLGLCLPSHSSLLSEICG